MLKKVYQNNKRQLTCGLFAVKIWAGATIVSSTVMSMLDFVEEIEVSAEKLGLDCPGLQIEKRDFCKFWGELMWSNIAPDCGDNPVNSL